MASCSGSFLPMTEMLLLLLQAGAAAGYKALAGCAARLGFKLGDVKSSVVVAPMAPAELRQTAEAAVTHALQLRGWHRQGCQRPFVPHASCA